MSNFQSPASPKSGSRLIPVGILFILVGLFVPIPLDNAATTMNPGSLRAISFIATDLFRLCFFFGIGTVIIGFVRNRKRKAGSN